MMKKILKNKFLFLIWVICSLINTILVSIFLMSLSYLIDYLRDKDYQNFYIWFSIFAISMIFMMVFANLSAAFTTKIIYNVGLEYRKELTIQIAALNYKNFYTNEIGTYVSRYTNDIKMILSKGIQTVFSIIRSIFNTLSLTITLIILDYRVFFILLFFVFFMFIFPLLFKKIIEKFNYEISVKRNINSAETLNILHGFNFVLFLNKIFNLKKIMSSIQEKIKNYEIKYENKLLVFDIINSGFNNFIYYLIFFIVGILIFYNISPIGIIFVISNYSKFFLEEINNFAFYPSQINSAKKIIKKWDTEIKADSLNINNAKVQEKIDFKLISLENVEYIVNNKKILDKLNLEFEVNKKYLILGKSGSGKSTILKILMKIEEASKGFVLLNKNKEYTFTQVINFLSFVDNQGLVFDDTINNNITMWDENMDLEKLNFSKEMAIVNFLDNKQDEKIKDTNLSSGQKQRVCIARALYSNKKILIFDEAMSNIDAKASSKIEKNILKQKNLTFINVSHNSSLENMHKYDYVINL